MKIIQIIIATVITLIPYLANSQGLQDTKTFNCKYKISASTDVKKTGFTVDINTKDSMSLIFDSVDINKSTARLIGNIGGEDVHILPGIGIITFLEVTGTGNVNTTSIYDQNNSEKEYLSSHSRHVQIGGKRGAMPSQWYGSCVALLN